VKGRLVVLAAPSGAGKTTVARALVAGRDDIEFSVSATTRGPREGELHGRDYYFISRDEFSRRLNAGEFAEWAQYAGNWYGTLKGEIDRIQRSGRHVLLEIEVQGAAQLRAKYPPPQSVGIFLLPPSGRELVKRLESRGTETSDVLLARLEQAAHELEQAGRFEYAVINDDLKHAVAEVSDAIDSEQPRASRDQVEQRVDRLLAELREILADFKRTGTQGRRG
jgi:guanylate kinase